ncbi:MAG: hypothetical protein KAJ19_20160, partial [Gammaproteobacteria bacterium]|nr:hypothetical protein [Gammaproteobacteria bacterium]
MAKRKAARKIADDPTKTIAIRSTWNAAFTRRYRALKGDINRFILKSERTTNVAFDFQSDPRSVAEFLVWLQGRIDARIFDNAATAEDLWQNRFIDRSYQRGARVARIELRKQGAPLGQLLEGIAPAPIAIGTAQPALSFGLVGTGLTQPIHLSALQVLYTRDFAQLRGITNAMSQQISRVLVDSVERGLGAAETARGINDRVDKIGLTRSKLLARTESVRAYNLSTINESEDLAERTGAEIKYEWLTAQDDKVRDVHVGRNRKVFSKDRALQLIGEP